MPQSPPPTRGRVPPTKGRPSVEVLSVGYIPPSTRGSVGIDQDTDANIEGTGQLGEGDEGDVELAAFKAAGVGPIHLAREGQPLLGPALGGAELSEACADLLQDRVGRTGRHLSMVWGRARNRLRDISA